MKKPSLLLAIAVGLTLGGAALGDGLPMAEKVGKDATKGSVEAVKESVGSGGLTKGAKEITKGVLDTTAKVAPAIEAQVIRQANTNKTAIGGVAQEVSKDAVNGFIPASAQQIELALGPHGDGPLADTLSATTERLVASAARGARSELHFGFGVWTLVLAFALGGMSALLCAVLVTCAYVVFQRRSAALDAERRPPRSSATP